MPTALPLDVSQLHRSPAVPAPAPPVSAEDKAALAASNSGAVKSARLSEIKAIRDGLAYLSAMASGSGILKGADHVKTAESVAAVDRFMALVRSASARQRADEDYHMLCPTDPAPHTPTFHAAHVEAP